METLFNQIESRRFFLKSLGILSAGVFLTSLGGCEALKAAIANRPTRRRLQSSSEIDAVLDVYRNAIRFLQNLDSSASSDNRGWTNQAHIHGTSSGFRFCHRDNREFLTWHRAYLYQFERICQTVSGDKQFAIPYWNWTIDNSVPEQFLGSGNLLNVSRARTSLSSASGVFARSNLQTILSDTNFYSFSELLRGGPHNTAHSAIGGILGRADSPLDPLFWCHHCMIDYCWYDWNINRRHDNPNDPDFMGREWNHFVGTDGSPFLLSTPGTLLMPLLSYQYEDSQIGDTGLIAMRSLKVKRDFKLVKKRVEDGAPIRFDIKKRTEVANSVRLELNKFYNTSPVKGSIEFNRIALNPSNNDDRVYLNLTLDRFPKKNDFFVRVFLNMPTDKLDNSIESEYYAGSFGIFGTDDGNQDHSGHENHKTPTALVELTSVIRDLKKQQRMREGDPIQINLITVPFDKELRVSEDVLSLSKLEIILTPVTLENK